MTDPVRLIARPMLASMFLAGGAQALRDAEQLAPVAEDVTDVVGEHVEPISQLDTPQAVRINGAVQVVGGALLALGKMPRTASLLLAGTLVPTTLAAHRFWEEADPETRQQQQVHFFKNLSMLGGLGIAAMDLEGRASLPRRTKRAAERTALETRLATAETRHEAAMRAAELAHEAKQRRKDAKHAAKQKAKDVQHEVEMAKETAALRAEVTGRRLVPDVFDIAGAALSWLSGSGSDDDDADERDAA